VQIPGSISTSACGTLTFVTRYGFRQILHGNQKYDGFYVSFVGNRKLEVDMRF